MVGLLTKVHRGRAVATEKESNIVEIKKTVCTERLRRTGFSGTFRFSQSLIEEVVSDIPSDFNGRVSSLHRISQPMRRIVYDPDVIAMVKDYLGVAPHVYETELVAINTQNMMQLHPGDACTKEFHYDVADFRSVTLFVYLNDVEVDGGAHFVIPSTHQSFTLARFRSRFLDYHEACQRYGKDRIVAIVGVKGTAFLEDLVNWHKRGATNRGRFSYSVTYTLNRVH